MAPQRPKPAGPTGARSGSATATCLFHGTISHNLAVANATATDAQMFAAAKAASVHDFVTALPDGYDTVIGARPR